jgi:hypothetical protein
MQTHAFPTRKLVITHMQQRQSGTIFILTTFMALLSVCAPTFVLPFCGFLLQEASDETGATEPASIPASAQAVRRGWPLMRTNRLSGPGPVRKSPSLAGLWRPVPDGIGFGVALAQIRLRC